MALIQFSRKGLFCPAGNFFIDPWQPVEYAIISHAHSDHARAGSKKYLCHHHTLPLLKLRLGENNYQSIGWNECIFINGVRISFHPAGHIIGSSQIRIEYKGEVWVFSGDFKLDNDGLCEPFEPIKCHTFITESTFGLPIYKWKSVNQINEGIRNWVWSNIENGITSVLFAYSLGKAQRVINALSQIPATIYAHGAVCNVQETLINAGWNLLPVKRISLMENKQKLGGSIIIAPPGAYGSSWLKRFGNYQSAICSGWMQVRGNARRKNVDAGFAMSDHADWPGLLKAVELSGAQKVFVTHGYTASLTRYLKEKGLDAFEVNTQFGEDNESDILSENFPANALPAKEPLITGHPDFREENIVTE